MLAEQLTSLLCRTY